MSKSDLINTHVLDGLIIGRVEPYIYAFTTETIPNYLKVGDTYRAVEVRLGEWRIHFPKLKRTFTHIARTSDNRIFRDYSVHQFLEKERHRKRLTKDCFPNEYFSNEFFEKATKKDVADAISDICNDAEKNTGKYQFYDVNRLPETYTYKRKDDYEPRPNQQATIDRFMQAVKKGRKKLLMYAVMRFGKTFTSMCCADEMKADLVVVVSAKPEVEEEWKKAVQSHKRFEAYEFANSKDLKANKKFISESKKAGKRIVLFLSLQDLQGKEMKDKHNELFKTKIDLLLVDESHFGARASEYGRVLQDFKLTAKQMKFERQKEYSIDDLNSNIKVLKPMLQCICLELHIESL